MGARSPDALGACLTAVGRPVAPRRDAASTTGERPIGIHQAVTWPDFSVSLMSLWLIFSPPILEFSHEEVAWVNAVLAGLLLLLIVIARAPGMLRAFGIASVGVWTAASAWALGIDSLAAELSGVLTGLCVLGLSIRELRHPANRRHSPPETDFIQQS